MTNQEFSGTVTNVAGRDINIEEQEIHNHLYPDKKFLPADPAMSRICTQCKEVTWRLTALCKHCDFNEFAYQESVAQEEERNRLRQLHLRRLKFAGIMAAVGVGFALVSHFVLSSLNIYLTIAGLGLMWASAELFKE